MVYLSLPDILGLDLLACVHVHTINSLFNIVVVDLTDLDTVFQYSLLVVQRLRANLRLFHHQRGYWVEYIFEIDWMSNGKTLWTHNIWRRVELSIFHVDEALSGLVLFSSLQDVCLLTNDGQSGTIADQVGIPLDFNKFCILKPLTQLSNEAFLNDILIGCLVTKDLDLSLSGGFRFPEEGGWRLALIDLLDYAGGWLGYCQGLQSFHGPDAHCQLVCCFNGLVHFEKVVVHLVKVLVHKMIDDLWWKVNPDVKDASFVPFFECLLEVLLDVGDDDVCPGEVVCVPLAIGLASLDPFLADGTVCQQMIDEFDGQHLDFLKRFER